MHDALAVTAPHAVQCLYAAVTLMVYIGGMAGDLPWLSGKQASGQRAALAGQEQEPVTAMQHRLQHAALEEQPAVESSCKAPASELREPEAAEDENEDEDWELLAASAAPDSSAQPVLPQQGATAGSINSLEPGYSTEPGLSSGQAEAARESGTAGHKSSCAKADLEGMSSLSGAHEGQKAWAEGRMTGMWTCMQRQRAGRCCTLDQLLQLQSSPEAWKTSRLARLTHVSRHYMRMAQMRRSVTSCM